MLIVRCFHLNHHHHTTTMHHAPLTPHPPGPSYGAGNSGPHAAAPKLVEVLAAHCPNPGGGPGGGGGGGGGGPGGSSGGGGGGGCRCCLVDRHDVLAR